MHARADPAAMLAPRALAALLPLVLALASVPSGAAEGAETLRRCSEFGCVIVADADGDGSYEWANVAIVPGSHHLFGVTVNLDGTKLDAQVTAGTEEALPHELGVHESHVVFLDVESEEHATTTGARLEQGDEETGTWKDVASATLHVHDVDGDGMHDEVRAGLVLP